MVYREHESWGHQLDDLGVTACCFAHGFEPTRASIDVVIGDQTMPMDAATHDPHDGLIAPGLVGLGHAYPEQWTDPEGHVESRVGFGRDFVAHARRAISMNVGGGSSSLSSSTPSSSVGLTGCAIKCSSTRSPG